MAALRQPGLSVLVLTLLAVVVGSGPVCAAICWSAAAGATGTGQTAASTGCHGVGSSGEAVGSTSAPDCGHADAHGLGAAGRLTAPHTASRALVLLTSHGAAGAAGASVRATPSAATRLTTSLLLIAPTRAPLVLRI